MLIVTRLRRPTLGDQVERTLKRTDQAMDKRTRILAAERRRYLDAERRSYGGR